MKTPKMLTEIALRHMIGHYGGMIMLFLLKLSYLALSLTIAYSVTKIAGIDGLWGIILFFCICLLFFILSQPFRICECNILYKEIGGNGQLISNIFNTYSDKSQLNRSLEITAEMFLRKAAVGVPIIIADGIIIYFTIRAVEVINGGVLAVIIIISAAVTTASLFLLYLIHSSRYIAVKYISTVYPKMTVKEIITFSDKITKGNKNQIMSVIIRVIPFYILTLLIFPAILTIPYIDTIKALLVKELAEINEKDVI
jgi:hypothetical protein